MNDRTLHPPESRSPEHRETERLQRTAAIAAQLVSLPVRDVAAVLAVALPPTLTHAATVPQPLAWATAAGHCPVLMSDTRPDMRHEGTLIGIHASREVFSEDRAQLFRECNRILASTHPIPQHLAFGALIGVARLVGVVQRLGSSGPFGRVLGRGAVYQELTSGDQDRLHAWWRSGSKWGLLLAEAVPIEAIPMRGAGGLWCIPTQPAGGAWRQGTEWTAAGVALEQWRKARGA